MAVAAGAADKAEVAVGEGTGAEEGVEAVDTAAMVDKEDNNLVTAP